MVAKKGQFFSIGIIILVIMVVTSLGIVAAKKFNDITLGETEEIDGEERVVVPDKKFGEVMNDLVTLYSSSEKTLFYLNQVVRHSTAISVHLLASNGGVGIDCTSKFNEYILWNFDSDKCQPTEDVREKAFLALFRPKFNVLTSRVRTPMADFKGTYTFNVVSGSGDTKFIQGLPDEFLETVKKHSDDSEYMIYKLSPVFKNKIDFDFKVYSRLIAQAKDLVKICRSVPTGEFVETNDLVKCVEDQIHVFNGGGFKWFRKGFNLGQRTFKFEVADDNVRLIFQNGNQNLPFSLKPVTIRLALKIPFVEINLDSLISSPELSYTFSFESIKVYSLWEYVKMFFPTELDGLTYNIELDSSTEADSVIITEIQGKDIVAPVSVSGATLKQTLDALFIPSGYNWEHSLSGQTIKIKLSKIPDSNNVPATEPPTPAAEVTP